MSGTLFILHMAGAVALLLWATRQVRDGVERAFGRALRTRLRGAVANPVAAVLAGLGMAVALQSSTAVTLLSGSFAGSGLVSGAVGIMIVRGGEIGSALVVKVLSLDLSLLVPVLLLAGGVLALRGARGTAQEAGRALVGAGLIIAALGMIGAAAEPLRDSRALPAVLGYLATDAVSAFALAAVLTYLLHSSIAAVLLLAALAAKGVVPVDTGIVMVLGINLGSSVIAPVLTRSAAPEVRAVPLANLMMRGLGSVVLLALYEALAPDTSLLGATPADRIVNAHIAFNLAVAVAGLPLSGLAWRATLRLASLRRPAREPGLPDGEGALDPAALAHPEQALANAVRAVVRMCETLDVMLSRVIGLYDAPSATGIAAIRELHAAVDARHKRIKLYLAGIPPAGMTEAQARRTQNLLDTCIKLEQAGDIVARNLLSHVQKKMDRGLDFTPEGRAEIVAFHAAVLRSARLAFNLLVLGDAPTAQLVMTEKDHLREMERDTRERHFERLRSRTERSVETSSIHLDTVRDLKQISGLLASVAHPMLEEKGLLSRTRLVAR